MEKILKDFDLEEFEAWSGAIDTKDTIIEHGKAESFSQMINELYPEGVEETHINDILWFDSNWCLDLVGIQDEDDEMEENEMED